MEFGKKVRELRVAKMMTQAELAGTQITRNMLCQIEKGTALPSLSTALYLASRLGVTVGALLSDPEEEFFFAKKAALPNLSRAFAAGDFEGCLAGLSAFEKESDDELSLLRAECEFGAAKEAFSDGRLRAAAAAFDRALTAAENTMYDTDWMRAAAAVYFRYLGNLSPSLVSDVLDGEAVETSRAAGDAFCEYVMAEDALSHERMGEVEEYLRRNDGTPYAARISALCRMREKDFAAALAEYEALLAREELTVGTLMYEVFGDMEICCRENDDYKRAYEFSGSRQGLLERLLGED